MRGTSGQLKATRMSAKERKDVQGDENEFSTGKTSPYTTKPDAVIAQTPPNTHKCLVPALLRKGKHGNDEKAGDAYLARQRLP